MYLFCEGVALVSHGTVRTNKSVTVISDGILDALSGRLRRPLTISFFLDNFLLVSRRDPVRRGREKERFDIIPIYIYP
jgi:hypothetical protein